MFPHILKLNDIGDVVTLFYVQYKPFGRRISLAHSDSPKVKENGDASQPEKEAQMKTAVVGICVPATADFCVNIIFSLSYKTANSFGSHSFHKMLQFQAVNQNTTWWVRSPWQVGEVGFLSLASDTLEV